LERLQVILWLTMALVCIQISSTVPVLILATGIVKLDPYLEPFTGALKSRYTKAQQWIKTINDYEGGIEKFSRVRDRTITMVKSFGY